MIKVTKSERQALDKVGLLKYLEEKKDGTTQDPNFIITNRSRKSNKKQCYVVETPEILAFLGRFEGLNLYRIRKDQLATLKREGLVTDENIQNPGQFIPGATVFIGNDGRIYCKKVTAYMLAIGVWKK